MRKWTRHINIFTKDYIVIPVNILDHWIAIIVLNLPQVISNSETSCCILYLNSLGVMNKLVVEAVRIYLKCELEAR